MHTHTHTHWLISLKGRAKKSEGEKEIIETNTVLSASSQERFTTKHEQEIIEHLCTSCSRIKCSVLDSNRQALTNLKSVREEVCCVSL